MPKHKQLRLLFDENPGLFDQLRQARTLEEAREEALMYVLKYESITLNTTDYNHPMERSVARKCINTLRNMLSKRSEELTGFSAIEAIWKLSKGRQEKFTKGFIREMRHLFKGMKGTTGLYTIDPESDAAEDNISNDSRTISRQRSYVLDGIAAKAHNWVKKYKSGLEREVVQRRKENKQRILEYFKATEEDWNSWEWQCRNVIRDAKMASDLINLTDDEKYSIAISRKHGIPFGITPYYAMLMDRKTDRVHDNAIRAQVIPPLEYSMFMANAKEGRGEELDFMGENDTSPEDLITRRYPMISIFKPYNTCAQICVYCQRNWEINDVLAKDSQAPQRKLEKAMEWYKAHPEITEILVTGGDPAIMSDAVMKHILDRIRELPQITRIRIGTRTPVVLPMRFSEEYADLLASYQIPGKREICVMTHFEHPYEVTPEAMDAVQKLRHRGISVYNQGVYTMENARRFEMVALRKALRLIGVDPYYTFNTKGKEEMRDYRIPIARLIQEQTEEARLNPGLERTDEAVFNIPRLGKNYLRAGQDHEVIMVLPEGERVYEFYPWDMSTTDVSPYLHIDLPIDEFLDKIQDKGEDPQDYRSIWYYL
ncbi:KamA family radical SAM protein [Desulfuribacillus stibiiarsenatis]|uniref:KamA family radical SAM protein n=1 Tax=Desulfuribacillus stibiiarsenatis TaxID=1390249 RepID=A0A1E5L335_9FIRM|nr:KamA family radical SAM protein [Desulfuribacillus stibiiarsenatis]OEH84496.1 KamA family radical SAM protein [Desulfuribacillus stibiiarsenatis]